MIYSEECSRKVITNLIRSSKTFWRSPLEELKISRLNFCIYCHLSILIPISLQEAIIKILKMRKRITNAQLQTELVDILKNMFLPSKKMIKEQIEWLIEHKYMRRDEDDINTFIYMAWLLCNLFICTFEVFFVVDGIIKIIQRLFSEDLLTHEVSLSVSVLLLTNSY